MAGKITPAVLLRDHSTPVYFRRRYILTSQRLVAVIPKTDEHPPDTA